MRTWAITPKQSRTFLRTHMTNTIQVQKARKAYLEAKNGFHIKPIVKGRTWSDRYMVSTYENRFKGAELLIAQNAQYSYLYARDILKGRFQFGENSISQHPYWSFSYAKYVLRGRFKKGEEMIQTNPELYDQYLKFLSEQRKQKIDKVLSVFRRFFRWKR